MAAWSLMYFVGSTGREPLRSSKCTCGWLTEPVAPALAMVWPRRDLVAPLDQDLLVIGVGRHPVIGVADQHQIAIAFELVAGIGDHAVLSCLHRGALRDRDVDAVIVAAVRARTELGDDAALHRPAEAVAGHRLGRRQLVVAGDALAARACDLGRSGNVVRRAVLRLAGRFRAGHRLGLFLFGQRGPGRRDGHGLDLAYVRRRVDGRLRERRRFVLGGDHGLGALARNDKNLTDAEIARGEFVALDQSLLADAELIGDAMRGVALLDLVGRLTRSRRSSLDGSSLGHHLGLFRAGNDQLLADRQTAVRQIVSRHDLLDRNAVTARQGGERVALLDLDVSALNLGAQHGRLGHAARLAPDSWLRRRRRVRSARASRRPGVAYSPGAAGWRG